MIASSSAGSRGRPPAREPAEAACSFVAMRAWVMFHLADGDCVPSYPVPLQGLAITASITYHSRNVTAIGGGKQGGRRGRPQKGAQKEGDRGDEPSGGTGGDAVGAAARR